MSCGISIIIYIDLIKFKMYVFTSENTDKQHKNTERSIKLVTFLHVLIAWMLLKDLKQQNRGSGTPPGPPSLTSYSVSAEPRQLPTCGWQMQTNAVYGSCP